MRSVYSVGENQDHMGGEHRVRDVKGDLIV